MKTIRQNIDTDLQTLTGSTVPWSTAEADTKKSSGSTLQIQAGDAIYQTVVNKFLQVKNWLGQTILSNLEGQVRVVDELIREGSPLYPYNFTGSPHSLFLLPNSYSRHQKEQRTSLPALAVRVERLDENRYQVEFVRKTDEATVNIYDEAGELLFTEPINQTGTFNLVYNLQWTGLSQVSFQVFSHNKFYRSDLI